MRTYRITVLHLGHRWVAIIDANDITSAITLAKRDRRWQPGAEIITITTADLT